MLREESVFPIIPFVARPDASHAAQFAVLEHNMDGLEQFLHVMNLRHAHSFADSANRNAKHLADSNFLASSAYFERYLCNSPVSPRRLLQLAVAECERPPVLKVHVSIPLRLTQLAKDEHDMHEQYLVAKNSMCAAFEASLLVCYDPAASLITPPCPQSCIAPPDTLLPDQ